MFFWWERIWQTKLFDEKSKANIMLLFKLKESKGKLIQAKARNCQSSKVTQYKSLKLK